MRARDTAYFESYTHTELEGQDYDKKIPTKLRMGGGGDSKGLCDHFPIAQKITTDPFFEKTQIFVNSPFSSKIISKIYI